MLLLLDISISSFIISITAESTAKDDEGAIHGLRVQSRACGMIYRDRTNIAPRIIRNTTGSFMPSGSVRWYSIPGSVCMDTNGSKDSS